MSTAAGKAARIAHRDGGDVGPPVADSQQLGLSRCRVPAAPQARQLTEPQIWSNDTEEGIAQLEAANDPDIDPLWPLQYTLEGWTDYSKEQIVACEGPGA